MPAIRVGYRTRVNLGINPLSKFITVFFKFVKYFWRSCIFSLETVKVASEVVLRKRFSFPVTAQLKAKDF